MLPQGMRRLFLAAVVLAARAHALCYTPDGTLSDDVACNPDAENSVCCTAGFLCMSNGLCQTPEMWAEHSDQFIRGTCTDETWKAGACGGFCVSENPAGGEWVMRCANATASHSDSWCCSDTNCCNTDSTKLSIGNANVTATAGQAVTSTAAASSSSTASSLATSTATSSTSASTASASASASSSASSSSGGSSNKTTAIGAGVGVGLGVALVGISGLWFWCRRRKHAPLPGTMPGSPQENTTMMAAGSSEVPSQAPTPFYKYQDNIHETPPAPPPMFEMPAPEYHAELASEVRPVELPVEYAADNQGNQR